MKAGRPGGRGPPGRVVNAVDELFHYLNYAQMLIPGSLYWPLAFGQAPGESGPGCGGHPDSPSVSPGNGLCDEGSGRRQSAGPPASPAQKSLHQLCAIRRVPPCARNIFLLPLFSSPSAWFSSFSVCGKAVRSPQAAPQRGEVLLHRPRSKPPSPPPCRCAGTL